MIKGFMGRTHALLSVMLLCICMLIPVNIFEETICLLKDNILFFIVGITAVVGGALLPDLDNYQSSAGSTLGFMGSLFTIFMQSTSSMIFTIVHTKHDRHPMTPHRYFWHTLVAGVGLLSLFIFFMPEGEITIIEGIKKDTLLVFMQNNITLLVFLLFIFMAILCGSNMILYRVIKLFKLPKYLSYILPAAGLVYVFTLQLSQLRILGICIGFGYLFHCIEDIFADSGVPILWPIPIHGKMWQRIKFFVTCETGSFANTFVDLIVLTTDFILIAIIFMGGD